MTAVAAVAIFMGGGAGALTRYRIGRAVGERYTGTFPLGTCLINVTGCFLLGLASTILSGQMHASFWLDLIATGFLGGYTTFSTYALEAVVLLMDRARGMALWSLLVPVLLGALAAGMGAFTGQHLGVG